MTTLQYCISDLAGRVIGFSDSEGIPVLPPDRVPHVMVEPVAAFPEPPTSSSELRIANGELYWLETAALDEIRERKNAEINTKRELLNTTSFPFRGKEIRCRPLDRSDIDGTNGYVALFGTFPGGWAGGWKTADNSYVAISTISDWKEFYKAMVDTGNGNFHHSQQLKAQLAAATTPEQIAAIVW